MIAKPTNEGCIEAHVIRHELGGLVSGLATTLDVLRKSPHDLTIATQLLTLSVARLNDIMENLERMGKNRALHS